jgi:hypothetical protein
VKRVFCITIICVLTIFSWRFIAFAKGPADKITISGPGLVEPVEMTDPQSLERFSPWGDEFFDSYLGVLAEPPKPDTTYQVRIYVGQRDPYTFQYAPLYPGYVYLPGRGDEWYETNIGTINRPGLDGHWLYASAGWHDAAQPLLPASTPLPATPAPLSETAIASCPVTLPNGKVPPAIRDYGNIGNAEETLFTFAWHDGKVIFKHNGPGEIAEDGSLSMKWGWYRYQVSGQVSVEGRRLDAPAPPLGADFPPPGSYGDTGFTPSTLIFSSAGCWEVTAKVGNQSLTFVTLAIKEDA